VTPDALTLTSVVSDDDQAPVLIEHSVNGLIQGSKLQKDSNSIIEELSTANCEYKKVNCFLINEIELLKKENDYLKVELLKLHADEKESTKDEENFVNDKSKEKFTSHSKVLSNLSEISTTGDDNEHTCASEEALVNCSNSSYGSNSSSGLTTFSSSLSNDGCSKSSNESISLTINESGARKFDNQPRAKVPTSDRMLNNCSFKKIDLSKYIDNEDDDDDDVNFEDEAHFTKNNLSCYDNEDEENDLNEYVDYEDEYSEHYQHNDDQKMNAKKLLPPHEFIMDS
jgi:hypothetical protein